MMTPYLCIEFVYLTATTCHVTFCNSSSRIVLLKGVDKDGFVW
jgi:pyridoxine/pyridoxamine 5'-phosphate oxidase